MNQIKLNAEFISKKSLFLRMSIWLFVLNTEFTSINDAIMTPVSGSVNTHTFLKGIIKSGPMPLLI